MRKKTIAVLETMVENSDKILFIIDELDTSKFEILPGFPKTFPGSGYYRERKPGVFVLNILRGDIFENSKKILLSRPFQYNALPDICKPKFAVYVVGLSQEMQNDYFDNEDLLFKQYKLEQDIYSLCAVPLNIESFIDYCLNSEDVLTFTNVFAEVFFRFCENLDYDFNSLKKLFEFAWCRLYKEEKNKFFFTLRELKQSKLDDVFIDFFFSTEICQKPVRGFETRFRFSSILFQDFFAALHLIYSNPLQLQKFLTLITDSLLENTSNHVTYGVVLFLLGFCNKNLNDSLKEELQNSIEIDFQALENSLRTLVFFSKLSYDSLPYA